MFLGNELGWKSLHRQSSQDTVARLNVYVSFAPVVEVGGKGFNVADQVTCWDKLWPQLCAYVGLKGRVGRDDGPDGKHKKLTWTAWMMS